MAAIRTSCALLTSILAIGCFGCGDDDADSTPVGDEPVYAKVAGSITNFATQAPVGDVVALEASGVIPAPTVLVTGNTFTIVNIPTHSIFDVTAGGAGYKTTQNRIEVLDSDISGASVYAVPESYFAGLLTAFGAAGANNALILRVENPQGAAIAGFAPGQLDVAAGAGPFVLDANAAPQPAAQMTSSSGYVVYLNLAPGLVSVAPKASATQPIVPISVTVAANGVSFARLVVGLAVAKKPTNVSFRDDVAPIFSKRGCTGCHDGGGPGKDLGGLHLNGAYEKMYKELTQELSPRYGVTRVLTATPSKSLVLTMPSQETPPDPHPNVTFRGAGDIDYLTILAWIEEGAKNN